MIVLALQSARSSAAPVAVGPDATPALVSRAAAPVARLVSIGSARRLSLVLAAAPLAVPLFTAFTTAEPPGWSLDFANPDNSALVAAL